MAVKPLSEEKLSKLIIRLAQRLNWQVAHFHPVTVRPGRTVTPVSADGKGFPDLVLCRERIIFAELKAEYRRGLRLEQRRWRERLDEAGAEYYVWNPTDWRTGEIEQVLTRRDPRRWERLVDASRGDRRHAHRVQRLLEQ